MELALTLQNARHEPHTGTRGLHPDRGTTGTPAPPRTSLSAAAATYIGGRRHLNDAADWAMNTVDLQQPHLIATVADGVGENEAGGRMAALLCQTICTLASAVDFRYQSHELLEAAAAVIAGPIRNNTTDWLTVQAAESLGGLRYGFDDPDTTLLAALVDGDGTTEAIWIGDSRLYILTVGGRLLQLTVDHNRGDIGMPHLLTGSVATRGQEGKDVELCRWHSTTGDDRPARLLLATDGTYGPLPNAAIIFALQHEANPARAARRLVSWAARAGGRHADNAAAVVVDVPAEGAGEQL